MVPRDRSLGSLQDSFNPCFNGFMDKWFTIRIDNKISTQFQPLF